jgi:hypothetical protein
VHTELYQPELPLAQGLVQPVKVKDVSLLHGLLHPCLPLSTFRILFEVDYPRLVWRNHQFKRTVLAKISRCLGFFVAVVALLARADCTQLFGSTLDVPISIIDVSASKTVHDLVLCVGTAPEKVNLVANQNQQVLLQSADLCLQVACPFKLLALVDYLVALASSESFNHHLRLFDLLWLFTCLTDRGKSVVWTHCDDITVLPNWLA